MIWSWQWKKQIVLVVFLFLAFLSFIFFPSSFECGGFKIIKNEWLIVN